MKKFLQLLCGLYIAFALISAHTALAPFETTHTCGRIQPAEVVTSDPVVRNNQRLDLSDSKADKRYKTTNKLARFK